LLSLLLLVPAIFPGAGVANKLSLGLI